MENITRIQRIVDAARERADRHEISELELFGGLSQRYFYFRIRDAEISSFEAGVKWGDENPLKSPWVKVEDDLPCNHKELLENENMTKLVFVLDNGNPKVSYMSKLRDGKWYWYQSSKVTHWFKVPEIQETL